MSSPFFQSLLGTVVHNPHIWSKWAIAGAVSLGYLSLVRALRWRRYNALHAKYGPDKMKTLTPREAQMIIHEASAWDIPFINHEALSFALFKTYGIPTISAILAHTKEFKDKDLVSKRYADTEILISTWMYCPMAGTFDLKGKSEKEELDPRAMIAVARVNWLHSRYKISNEDFLYTLSLFIFEAEIWAKRYAWRELSPLECHALFVFWSEIGIRMGIKDIPDTAAELKAWSRGYQLNHMVPAQTNHDVAIYTINELLHTVPEAFGLKAFAMRVVLCLVEDPVRIAMKFPAQPWWLHFIVDSAIGMVKYTQYYLLLPRRTPIFPIDVGMPKTAPGAVPRLHPTRWRAKPWYKPEGKFGGIFDRIAVMFGQYDDVPGPAYKSGGYRLEEIGPQPLEKYGHEEVMRRAGEMLGCPVRGPWSLDNSR